jgi:C1A family cysteine protease
MRKINYLDMAQELKKRVSFGWLPDIPDHRDLLYTATKKVLDKAPPSIDLRKFCPPVYDQETLGSCTANALAAAFQFEQRKQGILEFIPSRLFIYYNERVILNTVLSDSGAFIRDGIKTLNYDGVCMETDWPYLITKFTKKPPAELYQEALKNQVLQYLRLNNERLSLLKSCLSEGYPFVFGFTVFESFWKVGSNGIIPLPKDRERRIGGHAVMAVGYNDLKKHFIIRNSWGNGWGKNGYGFMPYNYIADTDRADDFWTIRLVEAGA